MRRVVPWLSVLALGIGAVAFPRLLTSRTATTTDFAHFESAHVHPMEMTPSQDRLLVVNTADNRLSVFDITGAAPVRIAEIPVGMEPVSVRAKDDSTAYVVNKLSDDFSVVDLNAMHVRHTVRVGDAPEDVIFAGPSNHAYVSVGGENVIRVYESTNAALVTTIPLGGHVPRSLAKSPNGDSVYVAYFEGGNRTTGIPAGVMPPDSMPQDWGLFGTGGDAVFPRNGSLPAPPNIGLVVQYSTFDGNYYDLWGNIWSHHVPYTMDDADVVNINAATNTVTSTYKDFGSTMFALAVEPSNGTLGIVGTIARNEQRFEPRVRGYLVETHLDFLQTNGVRRTRITNPHINYFSLPGTQAELDSALGTVTGVAADTGRFYVTSLANNRIGVMNPTATGSASMVRGRIPCVEGPTGIVVDKGRDRLYVQGRFRNQLQTLSLSSFAEIDLQSIGFDPTPDEIVHGRRFLYAGSTSGHGDQSCASCHVFGDTDNNGWDLGDPTGNFTAGTAPFEGFDPEKGVMVTQTLRGIAGTGGLHWRMDRADFHAFNIAFTGLMGLQSVLPDSQMAAFDDFVQALRLPPNPHQNLDRTFADAPIGQPSALRGLLFFLDQPVGLGGETCSDCHDEANFGPGTNGMLIPDDSLLHRAGFEDQDLKVPQLRNLYTKGGFIDTADAVTIRGFGYGHDGAVGTIEEFLDQSNFDLGATPEDRAANIADLTAYMLAFDTGMAPAVGHQITFRGSNNDNPVDVAKLDVLMAQATIGNCDLIAHGRVAGQPRGFLYKPGGSWHSDKGAEYQLSSTTLRHMGGLGTELTVMAVPPGSGRRMGVDRDRDGAMDGDELDLGTDPGDPNDTPVLAGVGESLAPYAMLGVRPNPSSGTAEIHFRLGSRGSVSATIYDVMGREISALARDQAFEAGQHFLRWDGRRSGGGRVGPGVYFIRVKAAGHTWNRTIVRIQ
jgi:YVTN family beta-propeller protein